MALLDQLDLRQLLALQRIQILPVEWVLSDGFTS